jgi:beta-glucosidase
MLAIYFLYFHCWENYKVFLNKILLINKLNKMNKLIIIVMLGLGMLLMQGCKTEIYNDPSKSIDERAADLVSKMTLDEKISLIAGDTTGFDTRAIARLGIPAIRITDGPIGVRIGVGNATSFPSGVATAASWDTLLIAELAKAMALETKAKGRNYLLGPCVGIHRFPFGGRNFESYSEDPYLASRLAVNWVKGLQSEKVISSVKHFATNDQEWQRNDYNVIVDERALREIHLAPFEAAIKEGEAMSVMAAYNIQNGQHCTENYHLIKDIMKGEWGSKGFLISDWTSVYSTEHAANAGLDLEMPVPVFFHKDSIKKYMAAGKITEEVINDKVFRLMRAAFWAGLFDNPAPADTTVLTGEAHKKLTLKAAQEGIILLKNEASVLPIDLTKVKSIAVIGPNAKVCRTNGGGSSYVEPYYSVSPFEGIQKRVGDKVQLVFAEGDKLDDLRLEPIKPEYLFTPNGKENGLKAEYFKNITLADAPVKTRIVKDINFINGDYEIGGNDYSVRYTGVIKPEVSRTVMFNTISDDGVRFYIDGKMLIDNWTVHGPELNSCKIDLVAGKQYQIKLEFFQKGGGAIIKLGWTYDIKQESVDPIQEAVKAAKSADVAIVFAGMASHRESEGNDPGTMNLPGQQKELIDAVTKANPQTIVVLNGGITLDVQPWIKNAAAFVNMLYLGQETGNAIASVLFGDVNPSGKLPFSYIKDPSQSPACKGYKDKSLLVKYDEGIFVGYRYLDREKLEPVYPFGYGLSYTTFEYSNIKVKHSQGFDYEVSVDIKNSGKVDGTEIAQLYISDVQSSVDRPEKELKGFSRVTLKAGETKTVTMKLKERDFAFWDTPKNGWIIEPGEFKVLVGASSRDIKLTESIMVAGK